ncbi:hypothetical protein F5X68DRAFT_230377 [Plectosphaerella plurivora]|uniref:Uncharacterized protein n=1 Tax=Plectosphaerella plurivora TaxID=936078 RepID=A0A9P8VG11_9PEZI|nr:hypothetical protein F5X68DRAFT_230377 [Plectosphaerella plurivora]
MSTINQSTTHDDETPGLKNEEIPVLLPLFFPSTRLPPVETNSIIVAAASPSLEDAHPSRDGWLLADFYAFNYLVRGLGQSQIWLTLTEPPRILNSWEDVKTYHHGNPAEDRRIIFDQSLLESGKITPVTVINERLTERFLAEVSRASNEAVETNSPLLIMAFCHGLAEYTLVLDNSSSTPVLMKRRLVIEAQQYFNHANPRDWHRSSVRGDFERMIERGGETKPDDNDEKALSKDQAAELAWRIDGARLIDYMAEQLGLTFPNESKCLTWSSFTWMMAPWPQDKTPMERPNARLPGVQVTPQPLWLQGPPFENFKFYLDAARCVAVWI